MKGPGFWYETEGRGAAPMTRALLSPVAALYSAGGALRARMARPYESRIPVICIGNVTLGGAGKTPVARAVLRALVARGVAAHALSRGYGGRLKGPDRVHPAIHDFRAVGDEPLLLAREAPAWVSRDRAAGARAIEAAQSSYGQRQAIVMDDGFQNPSLRKDLSILVIDAGAPFGNGRVFPAGPLREKLARALGRADAVVLMLPAKDFAPDEAAEALSGFSGPVLRAWLEPVAPPPERVAAFAGIGRPRKFFDTLEAAGAVLEEAAGFPDHHPFKPSDLAWLERLAEERGAELVTTEKDHVRLPPDMQAKVRAFPVEARFDDPQALDDLLTGALERAA